MNFGFIHLYLEQDNHLYTWIKSIHTNLQYISHSHSTFGTIHCSLYIYTTMTDNTRVQDDNVYRWVHGTLNLYVHFHNHQLSIKVKEYVLHVVDIVSISKKKKKKMSFHKIWH